MSTAIDETAEQTYRAIGRFMFEFSQLEYTIRHYLAEEIRLDDRYFDAVVGSYDVALLCNIARKVFSEPRANAAALEELFKKVQCLNDERNRVAHGLWVPFMDGGTLHHVSRRSLKSDRQANRAAALEKLADEANRLRAELEQAFTSIEP